MQVPKRKSSKSRSKIKRNSHYKRRVLNLVVCKSCGKSKLPHVICPNCKNK